MKKQPMASRAIQLLKQRRRDGTLRDILADWRWILSFTAGRWRSVAIYTLLGIAGSALTLAGSVVSKTMIDAIVALDTTRLIPLVGIMLAFGLLTMLFQSMTSRFSARLSIDMQNDVGQQVFDSLLHSRWTALSGYSTGDLLNRFSSDISVISSCAVSWLPKLLIQGFTAVSTLAVILYYDPIMALIGCASTPVLFLSSRRFIRLQREHNRKMRQVGSDMSAFQSETFRNLDTLKGFGVEDSVCAELRTRQDALRKASLDYNLFSIRTNIWMTATGTVVQYAALGYCLWRLWRGEILFGTMVLFLQQRSALSGAFSSLVSLVPTALSGSISAERVRELMELKKESAQTPPPVPRRCAVALKNVSVSYAPGKPVLHDISLGAEPGEIIALVGPSGGGKTTLLRLLLGLLQPESGTVTLCDDKGSVCPVGPETRHCFSYVPQGNTLLAGSVAQNLRLGNSRATPGEMIQALQAACAWDFVQAMPQGLDSVIGEGGRGLSEGQAQRIAIARALLRGAPVMLLDEVTSALDSQTEQAVLSNLTSLGLTTIVTTHRPSVLHMCSRVYQLENGTLTRLRQNSTSICPTE